MGLGRRREDLERAIETNQGSDFAHKSYANYLLAVGRFDEAIEHAKICKELDPLSPSAFHLEAFALMGKREYDRAAVEFRAALDLNPNWTWGYIKLAKTYADGGRCEDAFATAEAAEAELHGGGTPLARSWLGYTYALCGDAVQIEATLATLDAYGEERYVDPVVYGIIYAGMGDTERLIEELGRSMDDHSINAVFTPVVPAYYSPGLESDPRFLELLDRLGFSTAGVARRGRRMSLESGGTLGIPSASLIGLRREGCAIMNQSTGSKKGNGGAHAHALRSTEDQGRKGLGRSEVL